MAKLGQQVDVYCGRCKVERYHTVAAINENGNIERVVCDYCSSSRKYRDPAAKRVRAPRSSSSTTRSTRTVRPSASELAARARPYSPRTTFNQGEIISHTKYGFGKVLSVRGDRIDVAFWDGPEKTFIHVAPGD